MNRATSRAFPSAGGSLLRGLALGKSEWEAMASPEDGIDPDLEAAFVSEQIELVDARARVAYYERILTDLIREHPELASIPTVDEFTLLDLRTDYCKPESIRRRERIDKLMHHIDQAKKTGKGFKSITAFCNSLNRGAGIDRNEYYKWARGRPMNAPSYARLIEDAIDGL
jgi:hypothetical protein